MRQIIYTVLWLAREVHLIGNARVVRLDGALFDGNMTIPLTPLRPRYVTTSLIDLAYRRSESFCMLWRPGSWSGD